MKKFCYNFTKTILKETLKHLFVAGRATTKKLSMDAPPLPLPFIAPTTLSLNRFRYLEMKYAAKCH